MLWATAAGPPGIGESSPVTRFSPSVMSDIAWDFILWFACFCAWAVGPPLTGPPWPVISFFLAVMSEMTPELRV